MKKFLNLKITFLTFGLFLYQFLVLPIKSFALDYQPLEPDAFPGVTLDSTTSLGTFLSLLFSYGLAIAAVLAVIMIVWGGVEYMLSESFSGKDAGKERIKNAIYGLLLALVSWLILNIINPDLLTFKI